MKIEQLEQLIQIKKWGSFNIAAQYMHMTHQNLSYSMQQLEKELNITIFLRNSKGVNFTSGGEKLLSFAISVTNEQKKLFQEIHPEPCFSNNSFCQLNIALSSSMDCLLSPLLYNAFRPNNQISTNCYELNLYDCIEAANSSTYYDVIILQTDYKQLINHSKPAANYHLYILNIENLELLTNKLNKYAEYKSISQKDLESIPLVVTTHNFDISNLAQIVTENNIKLNIISYTNIASISQDLLLYGNHCALSIPSMMQQDFDLLARNNLIAIPIDISVKIATAIYIKKDLCETPFGEILFSTLNQAFTPTIKKIY